MKSKDQSLEHGSLDCTQMETTNDESKRIARKQRRISKQKLKVMQFFSSKLYPDNRSENESSDNDRKQKSSSIIDAELRRCNIWVPRQINSLLLFIFNGFICIEIGDFKSDCYFERYGIRLGEIHKHLNRYSAIPQPINQFSREFDTAVYLLEASQDQQSYQLAQHLKQYKAVTHDNQGLITRYVGEKESIKFEDLLELESKRKAFRIASIETFIRQKMHEDDFFFICDGGLSFQDGQMYPSKFSMTKNFFALIGIDEENVESYLSRRDAFSKSIPYESRKRLTLAALQMRVKQMTNDNQNNSEVLERDEMTMFLSGIELRTLDNFTLICNATVMNIPVVFPQDLKLIAGYSRLNELEYFQCMKFDVTPNHLDLIIKQRLQNSNFTPNNEECSNGINNNFGKVSSAINPVVQEDFEYSVISSIFIEKYYPKVLKALDPNSKRVQEQEQEIQEEIHESQFNKQRCKFKYIVI